MITPRLAIIIIHFGSVETTRECLAKLAPKISPHRLILINNTKSDISSLAKIIRGTHLIDNRLNIGFARAVNQGISFALGLSDITHVMLMNNDLALSSGTLAELLATFAKDKQIGIVSPLLHHPHGYDWGGKYNHWTGMVRHTNWDNPPRTLLSVDHVAGAAMLISRSILESIGPFDERYFLYYEDLDFCLRAKSAGYTIRINPQVVADHKTSSGTSATARTLYQWRSHLLFVAKHSPRTTYPTAFLIDLIWYPLLVIKSLLSR